MVQVVGKVFFCLAKLRIFWGDLSFFELCLTLVSFFGVFDLGCFELCLTKLVGIEIINVTYKKVR